MERRWTGRTRIRLPVDVCDQGVVNGSYHTRDISLGGVFVEIPMVQYVADTYLDLHFKLGENGHYTKHRIKGKVVRITAEGVGLTFKEFDAVAFRSLQEVVRLKESQS